MCPASILLERSFSSSSFSYSSMTAFRSSAEANLLYAADNLLFFNNFQPDTAAFCPSKAPADCLFTDFHKNDGTAHPPVSAPPCARAGQSALCLKQQSDRRCDRREPVCDHDNRFSFVNSAMAVCSSRSFSGSTLAVASSKMIIGASFRIARAIDIRCFSPPERDAPPSPTFCIVATRQRRDELVAAGLPLPLPPPAHG